MPFKSKAQMRYMFSAEDRGDLKKGTAKEWANKTKNIKKLPNYIEKKSFIGGFLKGLFGGDINTSFSPDSRAVVNKFMDENTKQSEIRKIENNTALSRKEKDAMIKKIMYGDYPVLVEDTGEDSYWGPSLGAALGFVAPMIALAGNSEMSFPAKAALVGGSTLLGGIAGGGISKYIKPTVSFDQNYGVPSQFKGIKK